MNRGCKHHDQKRFSDEPLVKAVEGLYDDDGRPKCIFRRDLPVPPAICAFEDELGQELFGKGFLEGNMKCYFALAQQFRTQDEPAYCGISTLVMVLNTFKIDSMEIWKGSWRFFHEDMLSCCTALEDVKESGIGFEEFICLAECNGAKTVDVVRGGEISLDQFREVVRSCARVPADRKTMVLCYSRKEFKQTGDGHYSPMGGYCEERDAVLILDVARFKLPAHWVHLEDLYNAMKRIDPTSKKPRGFIVLEPAIYNASILFTFRTRLDVWKTFDTFFTSLGKKADRKESLCDGNGCGGNGKHICCQKEKKKNKKKLTQDDLNQLAVSCFFQCMPPEVENALTTYEDRFERFTNLPFRPRDHEFALTNIKKEVSELPIFDLVKTTLVELEKENQNAFLSTILFLAFPEPKQFFFAEPESFSKLQDISNSSKLLQQEIATLKAQIVNMMKTSSKPSSL